MIYDYELEARQDRQALTRHVRQSMSSSYSQPRTSALRETKKRLQKVNKVTMDQFKLSIINVVRQGIEHARAVAKRQPNVTREQRIGFLITSIRNRIAYVGATQCSQGGYTVGDLNLVKESLCNSHNWRDIGEYQSHGWYGRTVAGINLANLVERAVEEAMDECVEIEKGMRELQDMIAEMNLQTTRMSNINNEATRVVNSLYTIAEGIEA